MPGKVIIVQGGQYGSEGKGQVCAFIDKQRGGIPAHVRTGSINAGHTIYHMGRQYKMQQIPVGWVNPNAELFIGAGAYVHIPTLLREVDEIQLTTGEFIGHRLVIDPNAYIHGEQHETQAAAAGRHLTIGATGKGCAEAVIEKIKSRGEDREPKLVRYSNLPMRFQVRDVEPILNDHLESGRDVLVEGTQGTLLDLHHGPYPYTTSRMTTSANWLAEAGISPRRRIETALVIRTYPIRVAGNSGPLPSETTWQTLWRHWYGVPNAPQVSPQSIEAFEAYVNDRASIPDFARLHPYMTPDDRYRHRAALSRAQSDALTLLSQEQPDLYSEIVGAIEMTTVTKKPRRIASLDLDDILKSIRIEQPSYLVVTFCNYLFPGTWLGPKDNHNHKDWDALKSWLAWLESYTGVEVRYYSVGPGMEGLRTR